jgi:hypothetical protein
MLDGAVEYVRNCTVGVALNCENAIMALEPFIDDGFEERWTAWQARGAAHDRTTRRRLVMMTVVLMLSAAVATGVWWL